MIKTHRRILAALGLLLCGSVVRAQSLLVLSSGSAAPGSPVLLDLTLTSLPFTQPVGIQWTFSYPASSVTSFSVTPASILTAAGKTLSCRAAAPSFTCIAVGMNANPIPDGLIANLSITPAATVSSVSVGVSAAAVALDGSSILTAALGGTASHSGAPILTSGFGAISMGPGTSTSLTFDLINPNANMPLTGVAFVDALPAGLIVATPNALTGSCGPGTIDAAAGGGSIALVGATIAAGSVCTFSVNVTATGSVLNLLTNPSVSVSSDQAPPSTSAASGIFVGNPFQLNYFRNLDISDSAINIINTGARGNNGPSGTQAAGAICVNAYVFSPDEQMVSCCSCLVAPDGLVSLSLRDDMISNPFTATAPASVVVKLVSTAAVGGICLDSASAISLAGLSTGMAAWGTKVQTVATLPQVTEATFAGSTLGPGELARLSGLCTSINAVGSGYGICQSCRMGGLGAVAR
jgi:hypothetical protein